jgi:hypothetical protein
MLIGVLVAFLTAAFVRIKRGLRDEVLHCKAYRRVCFLTLPGGGCIGSGTIHAMLEELDRKTAHIMRWKRFTRIN